MFALKLSSVFLSENTEVLRLCFSKGADEVGESGCQLFIHSNCAMHLPVLLTLNFWVSYLFVMPTQLLLNCYSVSSSNCKPLLKILSSLFLSEKGKPTFNHTQYSGALCCLEPHSCPYPALDRSSRWGTHQGTAFVFFSTSAPWQGEGHPEAWHYLSFGWVSSCSPFHIFLETDCQVSTLYNG